MGKPSTSKGKLMCIKLGGDMFRVGDTIVLRPPGDHTLPFVAKIDKFTEDPVEGVQVRVAWYYRPEEAHGGRKAFHGEKELFNSDHFDWVAANSINGKCQVHTLKAYQNLETVLDSDYFSRFMYKANTGEFKPDRVPVYCVCEMPYNPDLFMVECESCEEWYHPECLQKTRKEVDRMEHFICPDCNQKSNNRKGASRQGRRDDYEESDVGEPSGKRRKR